MGDIDVKEAEVNKPNFSDEDKVYEFTVQKDPEIQRETLKDLNRKKEKTEADLALINKRIADILQLQGK